jgi:hypothetical protein
MAELVKYNTGAGLGPVDSKLLVGASKNLSPEQLSAEVKGVVSPAVAAQRVRDILKSKDWLSFAEKKKLILEDAYFLLGTLRSQMQGYVDEKQAAAFLKTIKQVADLLDHANAGNEKTLMQVREIHARVMGMAIKVAFERALLELQRRYPEIPEDEIYEVLEASLPLAMTELDEVVELDKKKYESE